MVVWDLADVLNQRGYDITVAAPYGSHLPPGVNLIPTVKLPEQKWQENLAFLE